MANTVPRQVLTVHVVSVDEGGERDRTGVPVCRFSRHFSLLIRDSRIQETSL